MNALLDAGIEGISGDYDSTVATDYKYCGSCAGNRSDKVCMSMARSGGAKKGDAIAFGIPGGSPFGTRR